MFRRTWLYLILIALVSSCSGPLNVGQSAHKFTQLRRGVNLYGWFAGNPEKISNPSLRSGFLSLEEAKQLKAMGITHVRLPVDPNLLFDQSSPKEFKDIAVLIEIDQAILMLNNAGLAVVFVIYADDDFYDQLFNDHGFVERFAAFWEVLAKHLSRYSPERLFLEIIDEPRFASLLMKYNEASGENLAESAEKAWNPVQNELFQAIRRGAPQHTVILSGDSSSSIKGLEVTKPVKDQNVVYTIHILDPFAFTHQGTEGVATAIAGVEYPFDKENCRVAIQEVPPESAILVQNYCREMWDKAKISTLLQAVTRWEKTTGIQVWVGEFGTYPKQSPASSVQAYISDMRSTFEEQGLGWCVWDYDGWLNRFSNPNLIEALGLKRP